MGGFAGYQVALRRADANGEDVEDYAYYIPCDGEETISCRSLNFELNLQRNVEQLSPGQLRILASGHTVELSCRRVSGVLADGLECVENRDTQTSVLPGTSWSVAYILRQGSPEFFDLIERVENGQPIQGVDLPILEPCRGERIVSCEKDGIRFELNKDQRTATLAYPGMQTASLQCYFYPHDGSFTCYEP